MGECPAAPFVNNEADLRQVLAAIQSRVLNKLNLHEFFLFDVDKVASDLAFHLKNELSEQALEDFQFKFMKRKWFSHDHYVLFCEKFLVGLGFGPHRR